MKTAAILGTAIGIALGTWGAAQIGIQSANIRADVEDRCWVNGGVMEGGTCHTPGENLSPEAKVCMAMGASYIVKDGKLTCYDKDGAVKELPDLTGKTVMVMDDGTVLVRSK